MEKRYNVLRFVATLFKIIAWIFLILGILGTIGVILVSAVGGGAAADNALGALVGGIVGGVLGGVLAGVGILLGALLQFAIFFAVGELIYLLIGLEQNTRETAYYMRGESSLPPPPRTL